MRRDIFFDKQPPLLFIEDLKSEYHTEKPSPFGIRDIEKDEYEYNGIFLEKSFPDPEGLLETVYEDLEKFFKICEIYGNKFPVKTVYAETKTFEEYSIETSETEIVVKAGDTEGIRRALIWIEDEMQRREGPFLPKGEIKKVPHIAKRITRCVFSPINRPPKNGDELSDDIDYYPEQYLNRLMHDGSNGVWIYTRFSDLVESSFIKEYGKGKESRIEKLNRVIAKCKRYGISVYIFAIEPIKLNEEMAEKYPNLAGTKLGDVYTFCVNSEDGKEFCREAGKRLFESAPDLGGYIGITFGEDYTSCASAYKNCTCPRCKDISSGKLLSQGVEALTSGMKEQKPDADLISWTYGHRSWDFEDIVEYVENLPGGVAAMQNFDDAGLNNQLGKMRYALDYWLSYVGPSEMFRLTAETAKNNSKPIYAKMQVCCSHEVASVPYVPVPGNVYDKYKAAHELGVTGVLQCWYFGNYPCLMSKAAGDLAFENFDNGKDDFLYRLAGITWGRSNAKEIVNAYKFFDSAYKNYPTNIMFSYYGPMHDSVVWQLHLKPKNQQLPRTWQTLDPVDGDRIGECLLDGHTLEEAIELTSEMARCWKKGTEIMEKLPVATETQRKELSVIKALKLLFEGGNDILKFYYYRDLLGKNIDAKANLEKMREIVLRGIEQSTEMIDLWNSDTRLGYHSEGEGYKFFPEKLEHRIAQLKNLLETEFVEIEDRILNGKYPLEYYLGVSDDGVKICHMVKGEIDKAEWCFMDDQRAKFRVAYDDDKMYFECVAPYESKFFFTPEFKMFTPGATVIFNGTSKHWLHEAQWRHQGLFGEYKEAELSRWSCEAIPDDVAKTHFMVTLDLSKTAWDRKSPFRMCFKNSNEDEGGFWVPWNRCKEQAFVLGRFIWAPDDLGWMMADNS